MFFKRISHKHKLRIKLYFLKTFNDLSISTRKKEKMKKRDRTLAAYYVFAVEYWISMSLNIQKPCLVRTWWILRWDCISFRRIRISKNDDDQRILTENSTHSIVHNIWHHRQRRRIHKKMMWKLVQLMFQWRCGVFASGF